MGKKTKKRNKKYTGADAASTRPKVTRVQAVSRSRTGQWWHDRKRVLKPIIITTIVVIVIVWLVVELIRIIIN